MITLKNITRIYQNINGDFKALDNVSFSFNKTGLYGVLGPSGAGKSTLLGLIGLIDFPTSGEIYFDDVLINKDNYLEFRKKYLSFIFQENNLVEDYSVIDNLHIVSNDNQKIDELLEKLKLSDTKQAYIYELSGGEKQRISFIRTILEDRPILLCDEPTGSLDKNNRQLLMELLKEISKEKLVIIVSHDKELTLEFSDYIIRIENHKFVLDNEIKVEKSNVEIKKPNDINKKIIIKNELKYKPISNFFHLILFLILSIFITSASSFIFYDVKEGAKYNGFVGDVLSLYKDIDYIYINSGNKLNQLILDNIPQENIKEAYLDYYIPFVYDENKNLNDNEIIINKNYYQYLLKDDIYDSDKPVITEEKEVIFSEDIKFKITSMTEDTCNYISENSLEIFFEKRKASIPSLEPTSTDSEDPMNKFINGSIYPASSLNISLEKNEIIFGNFRGDSGYFKDLNKLDPSGYLSSCYPNLSEFYDGQVTVKEIYSFDDQEINKDNYSNNNLYLNDDIYNEVKAKINSLDLKQYVVINDNDKVIDLIYDKELYVDYCGYASKNSEMFHRYVLNSNHVNSAIEPLRNIVFVVYVTFDIVLIFVSATLMRNKLRNRKNLIGLLDLKSEKRIFSVAIINVDTFFILLINLIICAGTYFINPISFAINQLFVNTVSFYFYYPSPLNMLAIAITIILVSIIALFVANFMIRKITTKEIFKIKE